MAASVTSPSSVMGLKSFEMTQDILDNPTYYSQLIRVSEETTKLKCMICFQKFSASPENSEDKTVLVRKVCKHFFHKNCLQTHAQNIPSRPLMTTVIPAPSQPKCPICNGLFDISDITSLTTEQVNALKKTPQQKPSTKKAEESLKEQRLTISCDERKLKQVVKAAAIVALATTCLFLIFSQNKISITIQIN